MTNQTATAFPKVLVELESWVNEGKAGDLDFEMYQSFNEQYKPSDWTRNPASDEEFFTFGMDGTGGQVAIWRLHHAELDALPIVFLGSEGEVSILALDLPSFLFMVASGVGPYQAASGEVSGAPNEEMLAWVDTHYPQRNLQSVSEIVAAAKNKHPDFEANLLAQVKK